MVSSKYIKYILFSIALIDFMGFTISATIFPNLLLDTSIGIVPATVPHAQRLILVGIMLSLYPLGQFFSATVLGGLSDAYGRRKVLLASIAGTTMTTGLCALAINLKLVVLLLIARFMTGLFAGNIAVAQASMVDISDDKSKAANISLIQLSLGLAWVFGAPLGSLLSNNQLISWFNLSVPFWFLAVLLAGLFLILLLFYPETIKNFQKHKINFLKGIHLTYMAFSAKRTRSIFTVWLIFIGGWALFLQLLPTFLVVNFNYTAHTVGPMLAFMGGTFAVTQILIARRVLRVIKPESVLKISMLTPGIGTLGVMLSWNWLSLHLFAFIFSFSMGFTLPSLLAAISNRGNADEQGLLLGMAQSIQALATILVTFCGGQLLAINSHLSTFVGSVAMITAWLLYMIICKVSTSPQQKLSPTDYQNN